MRKNFFFLLLILVLSACTYRPNNKLDTSISSNQFIIEENLLEGEMPLYKKESINLPIDNSFLWHATKTENTLYFYVTDSFGGNIFYEYDSIEKTCTQLDIAISGEICSIDAFGDCLYILVNKIDDKGNYSYAVDKFDVDANNIMSIPLEKLVIEKGTIEILGFSVADGQIYVNAFNCIYCFDDVGQIVAEIELKNTWRGPFRSANGDALMIYSYTDNNLVIQELDSELQLICQYILDKKNNSLYPGFSHNQIFVSDNNNIYLLDLKTGTKKPYVNILHYNLSISNFIPISEELFFTNEGGFPTLWATCDESDTDTVNVLTCATYDCSYELQVAVSLFNFNHDDIKIDIRDYSVYNDGMAKLIVEMTAGKVPDIIDLSSIPLMGLKSSGFLQNIEGYLLEKKMVPNILETLKSNDGIFEFVPGFQIVAMASNKDYLTAPVLNAEDLLALGEKAHLEGKYLFPQYITQEAFISYILSFSGDSFVNIEKDYCNFENETFADLIQFASKLPSSGELSEQVYAEAVIAEYGEVLNGKQLISLIETGNPIFEILKLKGLYGDDVEFVGFPTNSGNGVAMTPFLRIGMSSTSLVKEEIQIFFDYLLSEDFQAEMSKLSYMPVIGECLDEYINHIVEGYREMPLKLAISDATVLECPLVDGETVNNVWDLIHRVDCINEYDTNIYKIVLEESQAFFVGHKDISAVTPIIQSRASLYVHERQ